MSNYSEIEKRELKEYKRQLKLAYIRGKIKGLKEARKIYKG